MSHKTHGNGDGESYNSVVLTKQPNEGQGGPKEVVKAVDRGERGSAQPEPDAESGERANGLERVREAAKKDGKLQFTALLHHVDGTTWQEYRHQRR